MQSLIYASVLALTTVLLVVLFRIPQTLHRSNAFKMVQIENISQGKGTVYLGYVNRNYQTLPLADFASADWTLGLLPDSDLRVLISARVGDLLEVRIPIAGSTQFVFITAPESGRVRLTDLETGYVSVLDLHQPAHYTTTISTVSGTKHAWDLFLVSLLLFVALSTLTASLLRGWPNCLHIWSNTVYAPLTSVIIGLTLLLNNLFMVHRLFFLGDSLGYWDLAPTFVKDGVFAFSNMETLFSFRGYVPALLAFLTRRLGDLLGLEEVLVYVIVLAVLYTFFFVWTVPKVIAWLTGRIARPYETLTVFALTGFFWLGWFTWLLSDLLAVSALLSGTILLLDGMTRRRWVTLILGGVFMGLAINCRPNYALGLAASFGLILYYLLREQADLRLGPPSLVGQAARVVGLYLLGVVLISLPQAEINWRQFHKVSLFPFASNNPNASGLEMHGTFLEGSLAFGKLKTLGWPYPNPNRIGISTLYRAFGLDPLALNDFAVAGDMLKRQGGLDLALYLDLVRKYPLEFTVDLFLKTFTALNTQSFEPYPVDWKAGPPVALFAFVNYCVLFFAATLIYRHLDNFVRTRRGNLPAFLWYLVSILPAMAYVPLFVEWRYFLPIYFGMYFLLVTTDRSEYARIFADRLWPLQFVLFILVCFSLSVLVTPAFLD